MDGTQKKTRQQLESTIKEQEETIKELQLLLGQAEYEHLKKVTELAQMTKNRDYMTECEATSHAVNVKLEKENKKLKNELARKDAEIRMQKESCDGAGGGGSVSGTWKDQLIEANRKYLDERKKGETARATWSTLVEKLMSETSKREAKILRANEHLKQELMELQNQVAEMEANSENLKRPALSNGYLAEKSTRLSMSNVDL